jgi:hypothetical protein
MFPGLYQIVVIALLIVSKLHEGYRKNKKPAVRVSEGGLCEKFFKS